MRLSLQVLLLVSVLPRGLSGQSLARRIAATEEGTVRLSFAARRGVCGDCSDGITVRDNSVEWQADCESLRLARAPKVSEDTRSKAVFWLSQAAGEAAGAALDSIVHDDRGDREIRKKAIFALSQRSNDEGVPVLIKIARANSDPELRKTALFWLGQSEDPRALDLFEELLR
ncbi:MAG TPA: HEAT repeat domain-containing protein [Gemmatimonadales bacterium]|nr:HEAT repeat domain-containing protein [Gemmatimonadales bacterium]